MPARLDAEARRRLAELRREERQLLKPAKDAQREARKAAPRMPARAVPHSPTKPTRGRVMDKVHKGMIAQLFCLATAIRTGREVPGVQVAHVRWNYRQDDWGGNPGLQRKPDDWRTLPLAPHEHQRQHAGSEAAYYAELAIYPPDLCAELRAVSPDVEKAREVLRRHVRVARMARGLRKTSA